MNTQRSVRLTAGLAGLLLAHEPGDTNAPIVMRKTIITGRADSMLEVATSSSEGIVGRDHLEQRPIVRPGELLEAVPGLIVTQHSGEGKANQFFLRGFNLDHGTDFASSIEGVPINLPTHAHGQGWTDLNFIIPELVDFVSYRKGPYFAEVGDFASAGAADMTYARSLDRGLVKLEEGSFNYARALFADSTHVADGHLLYAFEGDHNDGPWKNPMDFDKVNGVLRYS